MFYNHAARENLPIKYISTKELDYFIYNDIVYVFPDFNLLRYNDQIKQFEIKYRSQNKEEFCTLEEFFEKKKSMLLEEYNMPIKLLLATCYINEEFLDVSTLPESVYVISNYDKAFKEDNIDWDEIPKSTKMLYEMMLKNEKLGGRFEMISDDIIEWELDDVIYEVGLQCCDGYFGVNKKDSKKTSITHWHPSAFSIYTDVCLVGEKGNVLVVKDFLGGSGVLYMGPKEKCDIKEKKRRLSKVYFFESK
ncbi:MAG: hypothetical protein IJV94_04645 [Bacilli bacterium]|nr:hypothetical protein [Bacilli bacterium]